MTKRLRAGYRFLRLQRTNRMARYQAPILLDASSVPIWKGLEFQYSNRVLLRVSLDHFYQVIPEQLAENPLPSAFARPGRCAEFRSPSTNRFTQASQERCPHIDEDRTERVNPFSDVRDRLFESGPNRVVEDRVLLANKKTGLRCTDENAACSHLASVAIRTGSWTSAARSGLRLP